MAHNIHTQALALAALLTLGGCSSIAQSTNNLSDERLKSEAAGALGLQPSQLTLLNRRTEGTNTFYAVKGQDGKEYSCTLNGGNLLSFGMTNPPSCNRKSG
ncbi:hypothetical protein [Roseateles asaccharophilus]|uniref:Lipoprotein n=1 Tax=Roseateles asaccharophilus TaxID=582607 RepID=A0ABU2A9B4_9BURK|nr:hypothetical protein [Roseateles asaccharophilus]MDR7333072.1 hypothetical protein [Roseateles asaccharophilus]